MSEMHLTVHGRLVTAPQLRTTKDRRPFTTFRVATNGRHPVAGSPGAYEDGPTSYLSVTAFGDLGANAFRSLAQGQPIVLTGVLRIREFQRADGTLGVSADIRATSVGHDLTWGTTSFSKVRRGSYGDGDPLDQPEVVEALGELYEDGMADVRGSYDPEVRRAPYEVESRGVPYEVVGGPDETTGEIRVNDLVLDTQVGESAA